MDASHRNNYSLKNASFTALILGICKIVIARKEPVTRFILIPSSFLSNKIKTVKDHLSHSFLISALLAASLERIYRLLGSTAFTLT